LLEYPFSSGSSTLLSTALSLAGTGHYTRHAGAVNPPTVTGGYTERQGG